MNESLVQWILLKESNYLQKCLDIKLRKKLVEYYTTDFGIIDFALETENEIVVVELETEIDNKSKLEFCTEQVKRYKKISFETEKPIKFYVLFDKINTPERFRIMLEDFSKKFGVTLKTYSMLDIQELYKKCLNLLRITSGEYLGSPVAMDVVYLKWLNRIIEPYHRNNLDTMPISQVKIHFTSRTSFGVYSNLAKYFDLLELDKTNLKLTEYGKRFRDNYNTKIIKSKSSMPELSLEQKRILIETLTNGKFTKTKVNIYYFLRFVHLTNGDWVTKSTTPENKERLEFINFLFQKNYRWTTVREFLSFTCNQCEELGLVERLKIENADYDKCSLTSLGSRLLGYLELYLHLKREQIQLPLDVSH